MTDVVFYRFTWMDSLTDDCCRGCGSSQNPSSVGVATTANGEKGDQHLVIQRKGDVTGTLAWSVARRAYFKVVC
jgi:hypothetical protein